MVTYGILKAKIKNKEWRINGEKPKSVYGER